MNINNIASAGLGSTQQRAVRVEPSVATEQQNTARFQDMQNLNGQLKEQGPQVEQPIEDAVSSIQNFVQTVQRNLNFSLDDASGRVVVKVTDGSSGEVIRQIPSEEALRLAESLEQARSLLFKAEA